MSIYGFGAVSMALQSEAFSLSKDTPPLRKVVSFSRKSQLIRI